MCAVLCLPLPEYVSHRLRCDVLCLLRFDEHPINQPPITPHKAAALILVTTPG
jgi:hypothetical protein